MTGRQLEQHSATPAAIAPMAENRGILVDDHLGPQRFSVSSAILTDLFHPA